MQLKLKCWMFKLGKRRLNCSMVKLRKRRLTCDDRGVTLPEVLVAVTILAIIIVPLGDALIGYVRNTDATTRRMSESHDIQVATAFFADDVRNLGVRDWTTPALPLQQSVNAFQCSGTGTHVVTLAGSSPETATGMPRIVSATYVVRTVSGELQLVRLSCHRPVDSTGTPGAEVSDAGGSGTVVVHNLVAAPTLGCVPILCTGVGPAVPQTVTLTLSVKHPQNSVATPVTLTGVRRQT
jgi:prepilin-type N-terminal cleavage/methylation domain-containing protein